MKKTIYTCNLCGREELRPEATKHFKAFYWNSGIIPQNYVLSDNLDSCDKHICNDCINVIIKSNKAAK